MRQESVSVQNPHWVKESFESIAVLLMAAVLKFCRWGERRAIPCCLYTKESLHPPCWGAACPGNGCPMGSRGSLWKQIPKAMGYVRKYLGIVLFCCCFGGGMVLIFMDFFCFCVWTKPCGRGQHQEAACCQDTQHPAAALLAPLSVLCHLPVPSPDIFSLWQPKGGSFSRRFTGRCALPQPPQSIWIPLLALVLLLRSPPAASRAGTCWGELPLIYHPSALCFDLLSFFG